MSDVFLNGSYVAEDKACVSVQDRGFLFGDGVYEVIPVYGGKLFRLEQHLKRLNNSLLAIRLDNPHTDQQWEKILQRLAAQHGETDQSLYLQVTRGSDKQRDHKFPEVVTPTVFAMSTTVETHSGTHQDTGARAITLEDTRWKYCNIKAITLLPNVLLRQQAIDAGAAEAILLRDGWATEGAASNLFIVHDDSLLTPPQGPRLLPGVTRDLILELADTNGIPYREADISETQLREADEIWLTSSTKEIMAVIGLDEATVSNGQPGNHFQRMVGLYREYKQAVRSGKAS